MPTTLSFGYQKPIRGEKGDPVFDALESNIDQLNSHKHNGTNSDRVDSYNMTRSQVAVTSAGWSASGNLFRKTVNLPTGFTVANGSEYRKAIIKFYVTTSPGITDEECFPKTEFISNTSFYLYSPVSTASFVVTFV